MTIPILSRFFGSVSAEQLQARLLGGKDISKQLQKALLERCNPAADNTLKKSDADAFFDTLVGLKVPKEHGDELLADSTPYVATSVAAVLKMLTVLQPERTDVLCDVGAGLCRIPILVHLLTGMQTIGAEMDSTLTAEAKRITEYFKLDGVEIIEGDASKADLSAANIFAFNLPFEDTTFRAFLRQVESYQTNGPITIYPFCWHYYFWDVPWLKPVNFGGSEDYYFVSRS